jgi:hypothetical protein
MTQRLDDPTAMQLHHNRYGGNGKALIVLGGDSGKDWKALRDEIRPDVILGANGTCFEIDNLDYHLVVENLHMAAGRAAQGDARYQRIMEIVSPANTAKVKLISCLNWKGAPVIDSRVQAIRIKRIGELGDDYESQFQRLSLREYGDGFLAGPVFDHPGALTSPKIKFRVGTVAAQLLHLAGILGVKEVHSIGMDFCGYGHFYQYPTYQPDRFRTDQMFTRYKGLETQFDWIQGAQWLKSLEWLFARDGLEWHDHSHGLLEAEGLWCAS